MGRGAAGTDLYGFAVLGDRLERHLCVYIGIAQGGPVVGIVGLHLDGPAVVADRLVDTPGLDISIARLAAFGGIQRPRIVDGRQLRFDCLLKRGARLQPLQGFHVLQSPELSD